MENKIIQDLLRDNINKYPEPVFCIVPEDADQISGILSTANPLLDDNTLYEHMNQMSELGTFQMSLGSTNVSRSKYSIDDVSVQMDLST